MHLATCNRGNNTGYSAALHSLTLQSVYFIPCTLPAIVYLAAYPRSACQSVLFLEILIRWRDRNRARRVASRPADACFFGSRSPLADAFAADASELTCIDVIETIIETLGSTVISASCAVFGSAAETEICSLHRRKSTRDDANPRGRGDRPSDARRD